MRRARFAKSLAARESDFRKRPEKFAFAIRDREKSKKSKK
jgi:hypothetical protein